MSCTHKLLKVFNGCKLRLLLCFAARVLASGVFALEKRIGLARVRCPLASHSVLNSKKLC